MLVKDTTKQNKISILVLKNDQYPPSYLLEVLWLWKSSCFCRPSMFHEATIEVDEEGTSAAAATEIAIMAGSSLSEYMDAMDFHADHPFAFVIREEVTGSLLFFGHVVNPSLVDQD